MATSTDPGHFFQTNSSLQSSTAKATKATNTLGSPIHLPSKTLALIADPAHNGAIYVAESAGTVRRIVLETASKNEIYRSPSSTAPLTALSLHPPHSTAPSTLFAASWDKSIHTWSLTTRAPGKRLVGGHTDFIKTLLPLLTPAGRSLLLSGGSDSVICLWDASTCTLLRKLRTAHTTGGILDLAFNPGCYVEDYGEESAGVAAVDEGEEEKIRIFSAGSDRTIRRFEISGAGERGFAIGETEAEEPLVVHETSVNALCTHNYPDIWTASADGTAKCLSPVGSTQRRRTEGWEVSTTLQHGDYVRAVALDVESGLVVTAGRSEIVEIWEAGGGELVGGYGGHFGEIMGLVVLQGTREVVSVSVDCTVRRWSLKREAIAAAVAKAKEEEERRARGEDVDAEEGEGVKGDGKGVGLTEEEEAELDALMEE